MSYDLHDGTVHAWATNPTPPATWRQRLTQWRDRTFGPDPAGADDAWLNQMRAATSQLDDDTRAGRHYADNIATTLLARPIAIAAVPYRLVDVPHLGELPIGPLEPAHIHNQLIGAEQ
ncbi:hypothetical protein OG992_18805 [Micromonospora sp. NBC_00362]|uniref:hypothetical protein n=1 Tax=Micromonospora sp. NBC_00362 TaxID=2975975 RepID=UPI00224E4CBD|nr:hypothetical protein [Micromonospora sp. NBC_00362]MCX5119240.1 hypothetical protein [Micromonospora sp. NBC_00362]